MRYLGQLSVRGKLLIASIAFLLGCYSLTGVDASSAMHHFSWPAATFWLDHFIVAYFFSLLVTVIGFYLIEIIRDLFRKR